MIYDWAPEEIGIKNLKPIIFHDETLRDGLQSPSAKVLNTQEACSILLNMDKVGIASATVGFPASGEKTKKQICSIIEFHKLHNLNIELGLTGRTLKSDIYSIIEIARDTNTDLRAYLFIGSSPIRQYVENWDIEAMVAHTRSSVELAVGNGLQVTYITEDTTRSSPEDLSKLYIAAVSSGAGRIVITDTVGIATPDSTKAIVSYIRTILDSAGFKKVVIEFHGHMDRGLGIWNSIAAYKAGAERIHGTCLGIGERCGNTPIDLLMINCKLLGLIDSDLSLLPEYIRVLSNALNLAIPEAYPVFGYNAFRTGSGIHASAILKAEELNDSIANIIYNAVPINWFNFKQAIDISALSGKSNIIYNLKKRNIKFSPALVDKILLKAKELETPLSDDDHITAFLNVNLDDASL